MRQVRDEDGLEKLFIYTFFRAEEGKGTLHNCSASEPIWAANFFDLSETESQI